MTGHLYIVAAPSGAGKTTLVRMLLENDPLIRLSISTTTRSPRPGEVDGREYCFVDVPTFLERVNQGEFLEWAHVFDHRYGTPRAPVEKALSEGRDVLFDIDVQGASQLRRTIPGARLIFILPPSRRELERRLSERGTETPDSLNRRLRVAGSELIQAHWFNSWIINDDLETAWQELRSAYIAATLSPVVQAGFLSDLLQQWGADDA